MPLVNCILCFVNHALLLSLCYLLLKFVVYISMMPRWVEPMPSLISVNPKDFAGHTYLVLHQVKLSTANVIIKIREANGRLCIEEVGVDLEPLCSCPWTRCRSIMEASYNNSYFPSIISSGIGELILCNCGPDHMFFFDPISRASLSTCLLQIISRVHPLLCSTVEYYTMVSREYHGTA